MDSQSQELLNKILTKSPGDLTPLEADFLKARSSYLTDSQKADYKSVLEPPVVKKEPPTESKPPVKETVKSDAKKSK